MAQITSAMAAKYLRKLNEEHDALLQKEKKSDTYTVSVQEKPEDVRPEYDYAAEQFQLRELEDKIRKVKHAINRFNLTQNVPGFNMTIDQMLIYIPQLTARKNKLNPYAQPFAEGACAGRHESDVRHRGIRIQQLRYQAGRSRLCRGFG